MIYVADPKEAFFILPPDRYVCNGYRTKVGARREYITSKEKPSRRVRCMFLCAIPRRRKNDFGASFCALFLPSSSRGAAPSGSGLRPLPHNTLLRESAAYLRRRIALVLITFITASCARFSPLSIHVRRGLPQSRLCTDMPPLV